MNDAASIATMRWLTRILGRKCGASTGTNLYAALNLAKELSENKKSGSIVTMICDSGESYLNTYYNDNWLNKEGIDINPYLKELNESYQL